MWIRYSRTSPSAVVIVRISVAGALGPSQPALPRAAEVTSVVGAGTGGEVVGAVVVVVVLVVVVFSGAEGSVVLLFPQPTANRPVARKTGRSRFMIWVQSVGRVFNPIRPA